MFAATVVSPRHLATRCASHSLTPPDRAQLLVLVTVNVPLLKTFYFLEATVSTSSVKGTIKLGTFGYCVGSKCTSAKLGYQLDIADLLGIDGKLGDLSDSVLQWATYCLILHPIAAVLGAISVVFGLLAHMHNFAGTMLSTCFASFAGTVTLLAFIFDMVVFIVAQKRINSSSVGGSASLGNVSGPFRSFCPGTSR